MICKALVVGESVVMDQFSGRWSVFNMFNSVFVPGLPWVFPHLFVFASVADINGRCQARFELLDPELKLLSFIELAPGESRRDDDNHFAGHFQAIPFSRTGMHCVQLLINREVVATTKLNVTNVLIPRPHEREGYPT